MTRKEWNEKWEQACQPQTDPEMERLYQNWRDALLDYRKKRDIADGWLIFSWIYGVIVVGFAAVVIAGIVGGSG